MVATDILGKILRFPMVFPVVFHKPWKCLTLCNTWTSKLPFWCCLLHTANVQTFLVCPCFLVVHPCTLQVLPIFCRLWSHSVNGTRSLHGSGRLLLSWTRPSGLCLRSAAPEPRLLCSALSYPLALSTIPAHCQDRRELGARRGQLRAWPMGWPLLFVSY